MHVHLYMYMRHTGATARRGDEMGHVVMLTVHMISTQ